MRKLILSAYILCAVTATTYAQINDIKFGAKLGINIANISGASSINSSFNIPDIASGSSKNKMKIGFNIGVLADISITEKFSVQPEILYSSQGTKVKSKLKIPVLGLNNTLTQELILGYINIPIIAKYYIYDGLNIQAGPQFGFLVKESIKNINNNNSTKEVNPNGNKSGSFFNTFDFGLGFGLGYEFPLGVFIDARYNLGLSNINKKVNNSNGIINKNQVIQISTGYKFWLEFINYNIKAFTNKAFYDL